MCRCRARLRCDEAARLWEGLGDYEVQWRDADCADWARRCLPRCNDLRAMGAARELVREQDGAAVGRMRVLVCRQRGAAAPF